MSKQQQQQYDLKIQMVAHLLFVVLVVCGITAIIKMFVLRINLGKYYAGRFPQDSVIVVKNRTFAFDRTSEMGKRGNICSDDGTILLTDIYIYDLYWVPSNITAKDSALFMAKVDSLIDMFHQINPTLSIDYLNKNIKVGYVEFRRQLLEARAKEQSKDKKVSEEGRLALQDLNKIRVKILVSNISKSDKWVRQNVVNAIDSLFVGWQGDKRFKGGCQKDIRFVRRQLSGGFPASILGRVSTQVNAIGIDSMVFNNGIEGYCNDVLSGENIPKRILKVNDNTVRLKENREIHPKAGNNVITTINTDIQRITRSALDDYLAVAGAESGCAMVMEVATGDIKAIVNLDYDTKTGRYEERGDHCIVERFEPGSTFKLMTLMAALETGKIDTGDLVDCEKGVFSLGRAFEISDNDGLYNAARIAYNDKMDDFYKGLEKMGLQEDLDIEVANAKTPILRSKTLTRADFKNVTHGYSVAVPPIYMLAYYNAIANHGVYVRPRLIKAIQSPEGKIEMTNPVVVKEKICSQKTIEKVRGCLERVVMYGTARRIRDDNYFNQLKDSTIQARPLIAGKTGTAFIYDEKTRQYSNVKNSSFIGYFPADNPKYTCMVLIKGTTLDAGYVSAPACKVIAEKLVTNLNEFDINNKRNIYNVPTCRVGYFQDLALIYDQLGIKADYKGKNDYVMVERSEDKTGSVLFVPVAQGQQIPSMRGMTAKDAAYLLKKKGYQVCLKGRGKVSTISISGKTANVYLTND